MDELAALRAKAAVACDHRELSSYAFNRYGSDAKLYNGIHDLETKAAMVDRLLAALKQSRRTLFECAEDVAQCDALIAEAEALREPASKTP